jgi:hypothetical protein
MGGALAGLISVIAVFVIRVSALRYGWQTSAPRGFEPDEGHEVARR